MLVLARRLHERIVIPSILTAIEVTAVQPGLVRLGIEAPPEVTVLREEVFRRGPAAAADLPAGAGAEARLAQAQHAWRQRLHNLMLGLALLRQQLPPGGSAVAAEVVARMEEEVRLLCRQLQALLDGGAAGDTDGVCAGAPAG
jgi:carbon storage regulator